MTIGTSIICGSLFFTFTCHTPPRRHLLLAWGGFERARAFSHVTRTDDKEIRGSCRCGFCSGFYRGPHLVSIERGPLPKSVLSAGRVRRVHDSVRLRPPRFFPAPQCVPVTTTTSHPAQPGPVGPPVTGAGPFFSCPPSSCPAPPVRASRAPGADRFAGRPKTLALRNRCALPVQPPTCLSLRARPCACAQPACSRESGCALARDS